MTPTSHAPRRRLIGAALLLGLLTFVIALILNSVVSPTPTIVDVVAGDFTSHSDGQLRLAIETGEPKTLLLLFANAQLPFTPRVLDLSAAGYSLVGGRAHLIGESSVALAAYGSPDHRLVAELFTRDLLQGARGGERIARNGRSYFLHQRGEIGMVFWEMDGVGAALVSDQSPMSMLDVAVAATHVEAGM